MQPPLEAVKSFLRAGWMAGDFGAFAPYNRAGDDKIARQAAVHPGELVLDVACGTGAFALRAAQGGARLTGIDLAPNLIEQARALAQAAGLQIQFDEGDAEALPYPDSSFDTVVSEFGVMFAPRPSLAAAELARVLKPGGRVVLFNWTPGSWVGRLSQVIARHAPPPPNAVPPTAWGEEATAVERLSPGFTDLHTQRDTYRIQFPFGPAAAMDFFLKNMGPVGQAYGMLPEPKRQTLHQDLVGFFEQTNQGEADAWQVDSEYLRVEGRRR